MKTPKRSKALRLVVAVWLYGDGLDYQEIDDFAGK